MHYSRSKIASLYFLLTISSSSCLQFCNIENRHQSASSPFSSSLFGRSITKQHAVISGFHFKRTHYPICFMSRDDSNNDDDVDDDDEEAPAYKKRSLSWTRRYRRLLPYSLARKSVLHLGLRSKAEWDEYVSDGKMHHGPYLPNHPEEMYAEDWISWEEFLGVIRPYEETRDLVRNVLRLECMEEYGRFVEEDRQRAEGLRIPARPEVVYRDKGWRGEDHFFGRDS